MADSRRYGLTRALDIEQILAEAQHRWLRPSEICEILRNYQRFRLAPEPPNKPQGGSLFLFDRKTLRYFRKDGHSWRKKKDGKTVREAHEKLKAGSVDVLHCYYAHGEENENFQRRCYWMLDGQLEHIVLVHYREVNEGSRSGVSRLLNVDSSSDGRLCSGPCSSIQANSSAHAAQPSYASSPSTADWNGQTPSSDYEEMDSGDNIRATHHGGYAGQNLLECGPPVSHRYGTGMNDGLENPLYISKMSNHNLVLRETEDRALQVGRLACSPPGEGLPAWSVVHGLDRNAHEKLSLNEHTEKITMDPYNVEKGGSDATFGMILEANKRTLLETSPKTADVNMNTGNVKQEINFSDQDAKVASTTQEDSNEQNYHVTPRVEVKSGSPMVIALTDQTLPGEDAPISKNLSSSSCDDKRQGDLNKLDSFGRWMNREIGKDCDDSLMASDPDFLWGPLALSQQMQLDVDPLGYSLAQEQLFTILDFSPEWTYSGAKTKVLICGTFLGSLKQQPSHMKWCCMFGEVEVPAEVLPNNALRCQAPVHPPGRVPFYITCSNRLACSEVREFEYREKPYANSMGCIAEPEEEMRLQIRLARMLHLTAEEKQQFACSAKNCEKCNLKKQIDFSRDADIEWGDIEKIFNVVREDQRNPREELIQKLLKDKLCDWLVCKIHEEGRGPNILDNEGHGVIHLAASLGYEWAMHPIIAAGVSPTFRDARGWTGLHWAAYFGREETVITLIILGAAPGAVDDPTPAFPAGKTAADVASSRGHKGLAGYLAEADLTSHLSSMTLKSGTMESVSGTLKLDEEAKIVDDQNIFSLNGMLEDQLSLRGSLVAVRNSTQAAARIQAALRVQSFIQRQSAQKSEGKSDISNELIAMSCLIKAPKVGRFSDSLHTAAVRIQQKYRSWKGRREFLKMRNRIVKIQAHVRGHQVRKHYKKVVWSVSIVEKAILRWRRKGTGLRGFRVDKPVGNVGAEPEKTDEYDFLSAARRQKVAGVEKALARVKSMARYPEARDQYMRLIQKSETTDKGIASTGGTNLDDTNALKR